MKILIDVNLSHRWVTTFRDAGHEAVHWTTIGERDADDRVLLE